MPLGAERVVGTLVRRDPATFVAVPVLFAAVAALAC